MTGLISGFFVVALLYATVGFGGGSSYLALLTLFNVPYQHMVIIALVCNLIVVSSGSFYFIKRGHFEPRLFWPFALSSIPCSYLAGRLSISRDVFFVLLGGCLVVAGLRLLIRVKPMAFAARTSVNDSWYLWVAPCLGAVLGFLSGLVGIGGGIFLAPVLLLLGWGQPKQVAATASLFIFVNSLAGLLGQLSKQAVDVQVVVPYIPLLVAVFLGGQLGSRLGSGRKIPALRIRQLTGVLVLYVGGRVLLSVLLAPAM